MTEGTPKAIEMKGIVRNATKIGVQDGQAEDLINLRFMDGSWRASGDGRQVYTMDDNNQSTTYTQMYVHTNVYRHLLGVNPNGELRWFASIDADGVFHPLVAGNATSQDAFECELPTAPVYIGNVHGTIYICQTGHLITVIDEADDFEYFIFRTATQKYKEVEVDANGSPIERKLYPFGKIHFNWYTKPITNTQDFEWNKEYLFKADDDNDEFVGVGGMPGNENDRKEKLLNMKGAADILINKATEKNRFHGAMIVCAALKLYDGSYVWASKPTLINPFDCANHGDLTFGRRSYSYQGDNSQANHADRAERSDPANPQYIPMLFRYKAIRNGFKIEYHQHNPDDYGNPALTDPFCEYAEFGGHVADVPRMIFAHAKYIRWIMFRESCDYTEDSADLIATLRSYDLTLSLDDYALLENNKDVFSSLCIFVTAQMDVNNYDDWEGLKGVQTVTEKYVNEEYPVLYLDEYQCAHVHAYQPSFLTDSAIKNRLMNSPFYLLREYTKEDIYQLRDNAVVDLQDDKFSGLLSGLIADTATTLPPEAFDRVSYLPKVQYMYNGRLHIADYTSRLYNGYPIDLSQLNNHAVKANAQSYYPSAQMPAFNGVESLSEIDELNYSRSRIPLPSDADLISNNAPVVVVETRIDTQDGEARTIRYIPAYAYDVNNPIDGRWDYLEDLDPLLVYPDSRAKEMHIYYVDKIGTNQYRLKRRQFPLTRHLYLNMAYYLNDAMKPIKLSSFVDEMNYSTHEIREYTAAQLAARFKDINDKETYPNGLKVSKTNNPFYFPVENAYQVGSSEILALMSNTIAVGTGQTGAAPLYVFCKDGVYALYVDSSGQMAYPNARILARDVCNNPRSVTPIDAGVVFTTDRGLMMIAGEQVKEIGAPAEGDVVQFWNAGSVDYSKIATASMQQIAGLPSSLCSTTDFLTYLQDKGTSGKAAIINYNHNMRELMVSNPNYPYSYVLDREGNWSRRDYTAAQYVNNYPTSYRVDADGHFYKVDDEGNASTSLEHRKEADNKIFYLSNVIKLDSIGFKQAYRFVVRGYFETLRTRYIPRPGAVPQYRDENVGIVVEGSYDGRKFAPLGYNRKSGKFRDIGCIVERTDVRFFRVCLSGQVTGKTRIDYMEMSAGASMLNTKIR